jgi:hypothetical protein
MNLNSLYSIANRGGAGYVALQVTDSGLNGSGDCLVVIVQAGATSKQFLHRTGWQSSEDKLSLPYASITDGITEFTFPPTIVRFLELEVNYEFDFYDRQGISLGHLVVPWIDVPSFRFKGASVSPVSPIDRHITDTFNQSFKNPPIRPIETHRPTVIVIPDDDPPTEPQHAPEPTKGNPPEAPYKPYQPDEPIELPNRPSPPPLGAEVECKHCGLPTLLGLSHCSWCGTAQ